MRRITGILVLSVLTVALAGCRQEPQPPADVGRVLAAGLPGAAASETEQDSTPMLVRRVWYSTEGLDFWGGPSPDGRYLTFTDWADWGEEEGAPLAVHDFRSGDSRRVTPEPEPWAYAAHSSVSRDGKRIAYSRWSDDRGYELRLVDFDGAEPRLLYRDPELEVRPKEWSRDDKSILVFVIDDRDNHIGFVSVSDGALQVLKRFGQQMPFEVSMSPDGRYVVYDLPAAGDSQRDLFVITVAGGEERALVRHPADDLVLGWAPDGEHVLFASDRTGTLGVWLLPVADGSPAGEPRLVKPDLWRAQPLGFARKGSFYYGVSMGMSDVYIASLDLETGQLLDRPARVSESHFGSNGAPEWSPDGRYVAYLSERRSWREFGDEVIVIRSVETGEVRELQTNLGALIYPRWSPDGRSLLVRGKDDRGRGLFQIDLQTGEVEALIRFPPGSPNLAVRMEWLAEMTLLYWWREGERSFSIRVRDLDTGSERVLYTGGISPRFGVSPDKRQVAFTLHQGDRAAVMVMPTAGGEPRVLLYPEFGRAPDEIQWGPDGRHLYYVNGYVGGDLWRVPVTGGQPERLDWFKDVNARAFFRFEPGGQRVALTCGEGEDGAEIWVMEGFLPVTTGAPDED